MSVPAALGQIIDGRYRITSHLSDGGMGSVYIAEHIQLNRQVAVKTLRSDVADQDTAAKRFEREARAASEIDHPNVVQVLDFGRLENGEFYYVMELLQGRDFSMLLHESGRLPWYRVQKLARQLVKALAAAHAHGIVHRDIKPANCFLLDPKPGLGRDHVKVLDFGIAKRDEQTDASQELTQDSQVVGTATYMAPEQVLTGKTDPRSDIYSLGVVIYELLAGKPPFRGDTPMQTINHHINTPPPSLRTIAPELPIEVEAFVMRMLTKKPDDRFQTMADVEAALDYLSEPTAPATVTGLRIDPTGAATEVMTSAVTTSEHARGPDRARNAARLLALVGVLLLLGVGGWLAVSFLSGQSAEPVAHTTVDEPPETPPEPPTEEVLPPPPPPPDPTETLDPPPPDDKEFPPAPAGKSRCETESLPPRAWAAERGSLTGTVRLPKKFDTQARVCAWLIDAEAPTDARIEPHCGAVGTSKGRFQISDLPPGNYEVSTFADGHVPEYKRPVCIWPGEQTRDVNLVLEEGGVEIRGRVRDTQGAPIEGAYVTVARGARALARTDGQGRYALWVKKGPVQLVVLRGGYLDKTRAGAAPAEDFDISLERAAAVTGSVVMARSREGLPDIHIEVSYKDTSKDGAGTKRTSYTDKNGEFHIAGMKPGLCWVTATIPGAPDRIQTVELKAGLSTQIVVEIAEPEEPEVPAPLPVEAETETETGDGDGEPVEVKIPEVTVVFIAGRLKWAELRVGGQNMGVAEPTRTVTVPIGTQRVQYRQDGKWKDVGTIDLTPGKAYEARLSRNAVKLIERTPNDESSD